MKIVAALVGLGLVGRYLLRRLFTIVASSGNQEIMTAMALLVVLGTASIMLAVGLSMSLGAFLAGVLLAESEYRHELQADIEPFKGLLLGLFFMAVGMSANLAIVAQLPLQLLAVVLGFMTVKSLIVYGLSRWMGESGESARHIAAALPQGGEFAFVLFGIAAAARVMTPRTADFLVVAVTLSMVLTPLWFAFDDKVLSRWAQRGTARDFDAIAEPPNPVVIAGFGRVGQIVGRVLRLHRIGFTALDGAATQVDFLRKFGNKIYYGDATRLDLLRAAQVDKAKIFVLAIDDVIASIKVAELVLENFPNVTIYARARNRQHAYQLLAMGINLLVRETFDASLALAEQVLVGTGVSPAGAQHTVQRFAQIDIQMMRASYVYRHDEAKLVQATKQYAAELETLFAADAKTVPVR